MVDQYFQTENIWDKYQQELFEDKAAKKLKPPGSAYPECVR
ncbi:hypothetical protein [Photorhabdus aballayi]|nr:hypothetical protein [Photorhabdus aballayi]